MEVRLCIVGLSIGLITACSNQKTSSSVFAEDTCSGASTSSSVNQKMDSQFIVNWEDGHTSVEQSPNEEAFKQNFVEKNLSGIRMVEHDQIIHTNQTVHTQTDPNDTLNPSDPTEWGQVAVGADQAWSQGYYGDGVTVGVVDTVVDITHPQIQPVLSVNTQVNKLGCQNDVYGCDFTANPPSGTWTVDPNNQETIHATHVSGIIAADHDTGSVKGIAPHAKIIPANFMDNTGAGSLGVAIQAIQYVTARGAKVINASWGGSGCSQSLKNTIQAIQAQGVLFVAASGNDSVDFDRNPDQLSYPAAFNLANQITVAAMDSNLIMTTFSNVSYYLVHLAAPGANILSTVPGSATAYLSGTSMATPFVSGAAALLFSVKPNATPAQVKQALLSSVDTGSYKVSSRGRLDIGKAIAAIKQLVP